MSTSKAGGSAAMDMVRQFHETFGGYIRNRRYPSVTHHADVTRLRFDLIEEEYEELYDALDPDGGEGCLVATADALADLVYVIYGAALAFGIPLDECLAEVHRSNMSKLGPDGKPIYRADGKVLKGPKFSEPDLAKVMGLTKHASEVA